MILRGYCGAKGSKDSGPFHIKPKPMPKRKNCLRMNEGNPDYQNTLTKIMEGEGATLPATVPSRILKEIPNPMGQP